MRGGGIVAAACGLLLLAAPHAGAATPRAHPNCHPPEAVEDHGGSQRVRVFTVAGGPTYACDRLTGAREELFRSRPEDPVELDMVRVAGRTLAYRQVDCFGGVCERSVRTLDLRSRNRLTGAPAGEPTTDLVLYPTGAAAWISASPGGGRQVAKVDRNGTRPLDAGPGIEPGSLAVSVGAVLFWMRDGEPHWAYADDRATGEPPFDPAFGGKSRCYPKGSRTAAAGRDARLYRLYERRARAWHLYACNLRTGRRMLVARDLPQTSDKRITQVRFVGRFAAVGTVSCHQGQHCSWSVKKADLGSGRVQSYDSRLGGTVKDLVLAPSGSLAWIAEGAVTSCSGRFCQSHGFVVDRTLALSPGGRMYWFTFDGRLGTAMIDR